MGELIVEMAPPDQGKEFFGKDGGKSIPPGVFARRTGLANAWNPVTDADIARCAARITHFPKLARFFGRRKQQVFRSGICHWLITH